METLAPVALDVAAMRRVVERENGCIVWGGAVRLSPADDVIITVERPLDLDSDAQLIASVLSKKVAAGATHVVIDMPVGPTAKVRSTEQADSLREQLVAVGEALGLTVRVVPGDGSQPIGRGIGPALEARDGRAVLQGSAEAPGDLRERALTLAGTVLELSGTFAEGAGRDAARGALASGAAWKKFQAICEAQGGMREPPRARFTRAVESEHAGYVSAIDNRRLARTAKLAGAPNARAAGLELHVRVGSEVAPGEPLFTVHAESPGELEYALAYAAANASIISMAARG
jgi:thymidine phosphorylase